MINEEEKLDNLFREKLSGLEVEPPASAWSAIQQGLKKQKSSRVILLYRMASAAAVLIAVITAVWLFSGSPSEQPVTENKPAVTIEVIETEKAATSSPVEPVLNQLEDKIISTVVASVINVSNQQEVATTKAESIGRENQHFNLIVALSGLLKNTVTSESLRVLPVKQGAFAIITEADKQLIAMNSTNLRGENSNNSWEIGFRVSPGYSSQKSTHADSYRQSMTYSNAEGNADLNGGFSLNYKTSKRWSIESGVYYSRNGQTSGNSIGDFNHNMTEYASATSYFNTPTIIKNGQIAMNSTAGVINFSKTPGNIELLASLDTRSMTANTLLTSSEFQQVFDFIEIPVYLHYTLIDSKIDIDLLGGFSANLLAGNNVYMETGNFKENVGKTSDVADLSYSGSVGLGISYELGKRVSLSVEPRFNYYLNSLNKNEAVDYHPYRYGIFTGLNYQF